MQATVSTQEIEATSLSVVSICILIFFALSDAQVLGAIAPQIASGLGVEKAVVASSVTVYSVAAAVVAILLGNLHLFPRLKNLLSLSLASTLFSVAAAMAALSPNYTAFLLSRGLAGLAGGLISALAISTLANTSSYSKRGRQMIGPSICYFLAPVLGVPVATYLVAHSGWRMSFAALSLLSMLAGVMVYRFSMKQSLGSGTSGVMRLVFSDRARIAGIVGAFFVSGGLVGFTTYLGVWLSDSFHSGLNQIGLVYGLAGAVAVLAGAAGGAFADRFGKKAVALKGSLGMVVALLFLPTFVWGSGLFLLISLTAFFAAVRVAPLQALVTEQVESADRAAYIAIRNSFSQLGIAFAVALGAMLYPRLGMAGVAVLCSIFTLFAFLSIKVLKDPEERVRAHGRLYKLTIAAITLLLILALGLPWLLSFLLTKAKTRSFEARYTETPKSYGIDYRDVAFNSKDNIELSGWFLEAQDSTTTFVLTHGLFRSRYEMLQRGLVLRQMGYSVLLYDLRRHGRSRGEFCTLGYDERLDVHAALNYAKKLRPKDRLVAMGVSMGAAATLLAASERDDLEAVIAESSFLSFSDTVRHHVSLAGIPTVPLAALLTHLTCYRMNFKLEDFDILAATKRIKSPVMMVGAGQDRRMPVESVLEPLYDAVQSPLKRKLLIPDARHGQAFEKAPVEYTKAVEEFLNTIQKKG